MSCTVQASNRALIKLIILLLQAYTDSTNMTTSGLSFLMYFTRSASGSNDKLSDVENGPAAINTVISLEPTRREKQNSVINFQCKTYPSNAQKEFFFQCKYMYKRELAYLILIQCINKKVRRLIFIQCVYK